MRSMRMSFNALSGLIVISVLLLSSGGVFGNVRLPAVVGDNMVLQRGMEVPIWGWADASERVKVSGSWGSEIWEGTADRDGKWMVKIEVPAAGGPYEMTVSGNNTVTVKNILVGEVWVCSGQSNMQMGVGVVNNARQEIANANYPQIRLFDVPLKSAGEPAEDVEAKWQVCSSKNISTDNIWEGWPGGFSAVAYFFGREIHKELGVPVGLIATSWGGTRIEPWTPPQGFESVPAVSDIWKESQKQVAVYKEAAAEVIAKFEQWAAGAKSALVTGKLISAPPAWPKHPLDSHKKPTGLYNSMIHPLVPFGIRGALWYQGESNLGEGMLYHEKMKALIGGWRTVWGQSDFPFYYVQLAPFRYRWGPPQPYRLAEIWEAQVASLSIPNTGMAVTVDISDLEDIHPKNKQEVGRRLALWALAKTYDRCEVVYSGPLYKSMAVEGEKVRISFEYVGGGLRTSDGREPDWFEIAGADRKFIKGEAKIEGETVVVRSDEVKEPKAVRFGWHEEAEPSLMNKEGLPAS
ncbi:MAG: sialate O-acetylesterase, partial [Planctomycetota bacterium]